MSDNNMQNLQMKGKALDRESINLLLDMICKHKVITSKATNAGVNRLKDEAWKSITKEFNETSGQIRRVGQLRLKWENLKKNARRRRALIKQNKMGDGKTYIPRNVILDRVTSILSSSCTNSSAKIVGDGMKEEAAGQDLSEMAMESVDPFEQLPEHDPSSNFEAFSDVDLDTREINQRKPEENRRAHRDKNLGLAAYFHVKAEKAALENKRIKLENKKLELEIRKLDLENVKLELEISQLRNKMNCD